MKTAGRLLIMGMLASCASPGGGGGGNGGVDLAGTDDAAMTLDDGGPTDDGPTVDDLAMQLVDGGGSNYDDLGHSDSGLCPPGQAGAGCANPIAPNAGCLSGEICNNGLDDDCNGKVDDGCSCIPGAVEKCFLGPPGKHNVGACTDGTQTCFGAEFGSWGDCLGSIGPSAELCDKLDNDCNGCVDDGLCCNSVLACPGPGDPRIAPAPPYTDVSLKGELFYTAPAASWSWKIVGGPCDQLFSTTTGSPPQQSFTLTGANAQDATAHFTLSGDYTVTMTVVGTDGNTYTCTWVQHIVGPGVRFELCWDHTGTAAQGGADLDLHVHRSGTTSTWITVPVAKKLAVNTDDCDWIDCNPNAYAVLSPRANWGYTASNISQCSGAPATVPQGNTWIATTNNCPNPRLDVDNISIVGRPENANIDNPGNGDSFRAMVHYYGQDGTQSTNPVEQHPIVNIYCGGTLKASYGQAPNALGPCPGATCFNNGTGYPGAQATQPGQVWRVADVKAVVDATGNTTDCTVTAIHPPAALSGYYITNNDLTY
jgi:hypothetical protein